MSNKVLENLTKNPYVGLGLTALVVAVAGYFLVKKAATDTAAGVKTLATDVVGAVVPSWLSDNQVDAGTTTLKSWYNPVGDGNIFYYVTFPDGTSHFVWSVNTDGSFTQSDVTYRLGNSTLGDIRAYPWTGTQTVPTAATGDDTNSFGLTDLGGW